MLFILVEELEHVAFHASPVRLRVVKDLALNNAVPTPRVDALTFTRKPTLGLSRWPGAGRGPLTTDVVNAMTTSGTDGLVWCARHGEYGIRHTVNEMGSNKSSADTSPGRGAALTQASS
ncbi:hypothetical protein EVAR_49964_1 [Eumeta japonica]|uniref:Uncharacterized protein n=1 Tax=Eumeta variegata TaxID=151549 RepID=A0A4C1YP45_EUMVA|nr:hypothetical protein EVAR_49964_1 [Eumeta japonica]